MCNCFKWKLKSEHDSRIFELKSQQATSLNEYKHKCKDLQSKLQKAVTKLNEVSAFHIKVSVKAHTELNWTELNRTSILTLFGYFFQISEKEAVSDVRARN